MPLSERRLCPYETLGQVELPYKDREQMCDYWEFAEGFPSEMQRELIQMMEEVHILIVKIVIGYLFIWTQNSVLKVTVLCYIFCILIKLILKEKTGHKY